jgi:hypothetical protein
VLPSFGESYSNETAINPWQSEMLYCQEFIDIDLELRESAMRVLVLYFPEVLGTLI